MDVMLQFCGMLVDCRCHPASSCLRCDSCVALLTQLHNPGARLCSGDYCLKRICMQIAMPLLCDCSWAASGGAKFRYMLLACAGLPLAMSAAALYFVTTSDCKQGQTCVAGSKHLLPFGYDPTCSMRMQHAIWQIAGSVPDGILALQPRRYEASCTTLTLLRSSSFCSPS